jgi:formamidopyrimidine-DNA glycosylase
MPELPDILIYLEQLQTRVVGQRLEVIRVVSPFLVRTYDPPLKMAEGKRVLGLERIGKRIVFRLEEELFLVLHLMIAGRLHWKSPGANMPRKAGIATFCFSNGTLLLTEAGSRKRASLCLVRGEAGLEQYDPGGLELLDSDLESFRKTLAKENHTLKRALTDPHIFSGIGNAYSDEILHRARLSPLKRTGQLDPDEVARLHQAGQETLRLWIERLRRETGSGFPEKVTAFRAGMAVHGRYQKPCPDCGAPVQRIVYAENETNYCPNCQTGGRLLADRALSRLLKQDWPRSLDDLEEIKRTARERNRTAPMPAPAAALPVPDRNPTARFSDRVDNYVRYRPDYPDAILSCLGREAGLMPAWVIADVGSGTGILSAKFLKHGNVVYAVEPNDEMRAAAEKWLRGNVGFISIKATAEGTTLSAGSVDLIVAGQAFHWFDQDRARMEFLRILKPRGWVALLWNTHKMDSTPFMREYEQLQQTFSIDYQQVDRRNITAESLGKFSPYLQKRTFPNAQEFDFEALKGRLLSSSYAPLPGHPNFEPMIAELERIFARHEIGGAVRFEYETELYFGPLRQD